MRCLRATLTAKCNKNKRVHFILSAEKSAPCRVLNFVFSHEVEMVKRFGILELIIEAYITEGTPTIIITMTVFTITC